MKKPVLLLLLIALAGCLPHYHDGNIGLGLPGCFFFNPYDDGRNN